MKDLVFLDQYIKTQKRSQRRFKVVEFVTMLVVFGFIFGLYVVASTMDYQMYMLLR